MTDTNETTEATETPEPRGRFSPQRQQIMRDYYAQHAAERETANEGALTGTGSVFDPTAENIKNVKAYADAHPDELERLLDAENGRGDEARSTLVTFLETAITTRDESFGPPVESGEGEGDEGDESDDDDADDDGDD